MTPMAKPTPTYYVLHGDDVFAIEEFVARMRAQMGDSTTADLNSAAFDARTATVADVFNAVSALPFLGDKRLAVVDGWLSWLVRSGAGQSGKDQLRQIVDQLPGLPDWARLVFLERTVLKDSHPVLKAAHGDGRAYVKTFHLPKNPRQWLQKRAAFYEVALEPGAVEALAAVVGDNLVAADNELFKLAAYVGEQGTVRAADVAALTHYLPEESVFAMVDALGRRDGRTAMRLLHRLLGDDRGAGLGLLAMIVRQFRLLIQAREHLDDGGGRGSALAQALHVPGFVAQKLETQSRNFSLADLEAVYHTLLDIDRRVKTGQVEAPLALDTLIAALCE